MRAERFGRYQIYFSFQQIFQKKSEPHKIIERFLTALEFYQQINVALICLPSVQKRAEQTETLDTKSANFSLMFAQP